MHFECIQSLRSDGEGSYQCELVRVYTLRLSKARKLRNHHEIVRTREGCFREILQNVMRSAKGDFDHHRKRVHPSRFLARQPEHPAHYPVPSFKYPKRSIAVPILRRIFWWVEEAQAVRFWFHNFNIVRSFCVEGRTFLRQCYSRIAVAVVCLCPSSTCEGSESTLKRF